MNNGTLAVRQYLENSILSGRITVNFRSLGYYFFGNCSRRKF